MENELRNLTHILSSNISGYHQYCLAATVRPTYVSLNLCNMLGFSEEELLSEAEDLYAQRVAPADQQRYADFLENLSRREQTLTLEYRMIKKNGTVIFVRDTMTSYSCDDEMLGDSVLTDITQLKNENQNLRFLNETRPCG